MSMTDPNERETLPSGSKNPANAIPAIPPLPPRQAFLENTGSLLLGGIRLKPLGAALQRYDTRRERYQQASQDYLTRAHRLIVATSRLAALPNTATRDEQVTAQTERDAAHAQLTVSEVALEKEFETVSYAFAEVASHWAKFQWLSRIVHLVAPPSAQAFEAIAELASAVQLGRAQIELAIESFDFRAALRQMAAEAAATLSHH